MGLFSALLACSSYSEPYTYGQNAAQGLSWVMSEVLPQHTGLTVSGVIYRYTVTKDTADYMLVHVSNREKDGTGFVFRETDDWSGLPGSTINKAVPVDHIPISRWGDGSIDVEGRGTVSNASVTYTYRIDECFTPVAGCPNYKPEVPEINYEIYNATDDQYVKDALKPTDSPKTVEPDKISTEERKKKALSTADYALTVQQQAVLTAMASIDLSSYYAKTIQGGVYKESVALKDKKLPDSRLGLRNNFAQQVLHNRMVDSQWRQ